MEQQIDNSTQQNSLLGKRPKLITVFCIIGFIGVSFILAGLFMPTARQLLIQQYGVLFIPVTLLTTSLGLIGLIGYWKMRKWGVYVYTSMAVISIGYGLIVGISFDFLDYILPLVMVGVGFANLKKMG
ncbi:hypothetical protein KKG15_00105 [Patescibacteria group bacterium]|nr:hypothetical protein [Patescibacteria group bacterium]